MNKKSGFTLAEVLVTLMIIGVIAAMTIPSLMQSTAQQEYKAAYKKAVSMLNQAVTLNYALEGEDASNYTGSDFYNLLTARLNVVSTVDGGLYTADGMYFSGGSDGGACSVNAESPMASGNICSVVTVDVNGQKGPNRSTSSTNGVYDIFEVAIYPQKAVPNSEYEGEIFYGKK